MTDTYEFRIAGRISEELLGTFEPASAQLDQAETVFLRAVGDDSELFGVISRCESLGLRLVSLRKLTDEVPQRAV